MHNSHHERHVLITGGASGIGNAAARNLAEQGWLVTIIDRKKPRASLSGASLLFRLADVNDESAFASAIRDLPSRLDALILCAAESPFLPDPERILRTNGCAPVQNVFACRRQLRRDASVVFVGSTAAYRVQLTARWRDLLKNLLRGEAQPNVPLAKRLDSQTAYRIAKAMTVESAMQFAKQFAPERIRVNCVIPGPTVTSMTAPVRRNSPLHWKKLLGEVPFHRPNTPGEVGAVIAFLCHEAARNVTGSLLRLDGGWYVKNRIQKAPFS